MKTIRMTATCQEDANKLQLCNLGATTPGSCREAGMPIGGPRRVRRYLWGTPPAFSSQFFKRESAKKVNPGENPH